MNSKNMHGEKIKIIVLCVEYFYDSGKSSCECCGHYSLNNMLVSVIAKLWTSGGEGKKFGTEENDKDM